MVFSNYKKSIRENKKIFQQNKKFERQDHFRCVSLDNEKKWILNTKKLLKYYKINYKQNDFFSRSVK